MAGVYTDNQPDFSFLQPGETKTWSQYWYPIQKIGPAQHANLDAAISLSFANKRTATRRCRHRHISHDAIVTVHAKGKTACAVSTRDLSPGDAVGRENQTAERHCRNGSAHAGHDDAGTEIHFLSAQAAREGRSPAARHRTARAGRNRQHRRTCSSPACIWSNIATPRARPTLYWREALRRDPLDARCNNALGLWHLRRGEFAEAEKHFRKAIERLTRRNPNPYDGEAYYNLGLCLRYLGPRRRGLRRILQGDVESGLGGGRLSRAGGD